MTTSQDGSSAYYRSATLFDPHQVQSLSVEWAMPMDAEFSSIEKTQLMSTLEAAIFKETEALPKTVGGHPVIIRAVITRVKPVSPVLNVVAAVLLTVPLDRGGAAVEIEILDAETRQPLASMSHAQFAPLSEFKARFVRLAPAKFALQAAAEKFAALLRVAD